MPLNLYISHVPFEGYSGDFADFRFDINRHSDSTMFKPEMKRGFAFYRFWLHCLLPYIKQFHPGHYDLFYQLSLLCAEEDVMLKKENRLSQLTYQFLERNRIKGFLIPKQVQDLVHALNNLQICKQEIVKYARDNVDREIVPTVKFYLHKENVLEELHRYVAQMDANEFLVLWEE